MIHLTINDTACTVPEEASILDAAAAYDIYIPTLCYHPDLPPFMNVPLAPRVFRGNQAFEGEGAPDNERTNLEGCGLCVVEVNGRADPVRACCTSVSDDLVVRTDTEALRTLRRANLAKIFARHPHACLTCAQREGCSLEDCSSNVPKEERCCSRFHTCELRKVAEFVGIKEDTARYQPAGFSSLDREPLFRRDFDLCIDCTRCVRACNMLRGVEALGVVYHDGRLIVGSIAPTLAESGCKFCGACVEVCPTGCLTDKNAPAGDRERRLLPCVHSCPAGADVPGYIRRIAAGDFAGAAALIHESLPLANTLGYICFHLCEYECRRSDIDDALAICALKRFAMESGNGVPTGYSDKTPHTGKNIAVVGAGPAGLAAAHSLRFKGHAVTIFEAADSPGGMPAVSVPPYRLPQEALAKDVAAIRNLGVEIKTGCELSSAQAMVDLLKQGFDAVLVAVGLPHSKRITLEGSDLNRVFWGLDFLREAKAGKRFDLGKKVVVVGGGNVAIDVAMTALRLSAGQVRLYCLENRREMPAHATEVEKAEAEGIEVNPGWGPIAIHGTNAGVTGVEFCRCVSVFDERHNFSPKYDERERMSVNGNSVILAIGQSATDELPAPQKGLFCAGDVAGGNEGGSVVHAVASGRSAAERIDRYLGGDGDLSYPPRGRRPPEAWIGREEGFVPRPRVPIPCAALEERRVDFRLIEGSYSSDLAVSEARRCLQCDLRLMIAAPPLPPEKWQEFTRVNLDQVPVVDGVFVLADAEKKPVEIKGTADIRAGLLERLEAGVAARYFFWEKERLYTKRESELIQQHLGRYGELPGGGDAELDDLF